MIRRVLLSGLLLSLPTLSAGEETQLRLSTYVTAHQVNRLFSSAEGRRRGLEAFRRFGITKVYLEGLRSGFSPADGIMRETRDFFRREGLGVSGGVATTSGKDFGVPSNRTDLFLNYEAEKTKRDMAERMRRLASLFSEIMVDDFFATDDASAESQRARKDRSWSAYRLDLMTDFARKRMIGPAREVNPNVKLIIKYPQWYDRFHNFGYDVVREPVIFDRVWVGTETRNPRTPRFGYVVPTEGYINFMWLRSVGKEKTGGAWFDFHDCTPEIYLMQAYQSVLAGARELTLFDTARVVEGTDAARRLLGRREALFALARILRGRKPLGMWAYKPPHSEGSGPEGGANLFVYDYVAALGLSPLPTAELPQRAASVFLPRHAACDPRISEKVKRFLDRGATVVVTPDFLAAGGDRKIAELAGYSGVPELKSGELEVTRFRVGSGEVRAKRKVRLRPVGTPAKAEVLCAGLGAAGEIPILTCRSLPSGGRILLFNIATFSYDEFKPPELVLLPPRPLSIGNWPPEVVDRIRSALPAPCGVRVEGANSVGVCFFSGKLLVLSNFNAEEVRVTLFSTGKEKPVFRLEKEFPHVSGARLERKDGARAVVTVPAWELSVVRWE